MRKLNISFMNHVNISLVLVMALWSIGGTSCGAPKYAVTGSVNSLKELCRAAAEDEYRGLLDREQFSQNLSGKIGGENFARARALYLRVEAVARKLKPGVGSKSRNRLIGCALMRAGWFEFQTRSDKNDGRIALRVLKWSRDFFQENPIALYEIGYIGYALNGKAGRPAFVQSCERAVKIDPMFSLAWLQIRLKFLRDGDGQSEASKSSAESFLKSMSHFRPELYFFDTGFPSKDMGISDPFGDGKPLKRVNYKTGDKRFDLESSLVY